MIRKHKKYSRPRKMFDKIRIEAENVLKDRYGLKNKKEIWKAEARIDEIRGQAKKLIMADAEAQEKFFEKLRKIGLKIEKMADVLALNKEDWLKRRLQSIIVGKIAKTPKQARQWIAHKHIAINGKIINIPSYIVTVEDENKIEIVKLNKKMEEIKHD